MEVNTQRRAAGLKEKIPDMQKTLDTVRFLAIRTVRTRKAVPHERGAGDPDGLNSITGKVLIENKARRVGSD